MITELCGILLWKNQSAIQHNITKLGNIILPMYNLWSERVIVTSIKMSLNSAEHVIWQNNKTIQMKIVWLIEEDLYKNPAWNLNVYGKSILSVSTVQ